MKQPEPAGSGKELLIAPDITPLLHILGYLNPLSPAVEAYLKEVITRVGATSVKDMGKVMGTANKELAGKADGRTISEVVKQLLG